MRVQRVRLVLGTLAASLACAVHADEGEPETAQAHFQATYVWQKKAAFPADYSGPNSLSTAAAKSYSFTGTAFLGWRPFAATELYFDPEVAQGVPFDDLTGLAGFTNGELARTSGAQPTFYRARLFLRQTFDLGGERQPVESDANQLAGPVAANRLVVTVGNLAVGDLFDRNTFSHDPRTQFLNWTLMSHGAYDFAADARGYTWGFAAEWFHESWVVRAGRFALPREPNVLRLDPSIFKHYGDQLEVEKDWSIGGSPGAVRLLAFRDYALMARYRDALELGTPTPDINLVRNHERSKVGLGINMEQALGDAAGLFLRASRADGKTETYAFTEADDSLSFGAVVKPVRWGRERDSFGIAIASNGLSRDHRQYLAAGGLGFFIGDAALDYRRETILETFYAWSPRKGLQLSADYQRVWNPAYNSARGPVDFVALRAHIDF